MALIIKGEHNVAGTLKEVQKVCGEGLVGKGLKLPARPTIPSGAFAFDLATGGGIPINRITLGHGNEGGGKTLLATCLIREFQARFPDYPCVLVEPEGAYDTDWATRAGVDTDALIIARPEYAEQAADIVFAFLKAPDCGLLVLDSIAVLSGQDEMEKSQEDAIVGGTSKCINRMIRRASALLRRAEREERPTTMFAINQPRFKTGVMYGSPETLPGGMQQHYQSSLRVRLYGKQIIVPEVSKDYASVLEVSGTITKYRQRIAARQFKYEMVLAPHKGLEVGRCNDWTPFKQHAMAQGLIEKVKAGWGLTDPETGEQHEFKTQIELWEYVRSVPDRLDQYRDKILEELLP